MKAYRIQRVRVTLDKYWTLEKYNFTTTVLSSYIGSETDTDLLSSPMGVDYVVIGFDMEIQP